MIGPVIKSMCIAVLYVALQNKSIDSFLSFWRKTLDKFYLAGFTNVFPAGAL